MVVAPYLFYCISSDTDCMSTTASELLDAVNTAILDLITGSSVTITFEGRTYQKHDLDKLRLMRTELRKETRSSSCQIRLADISGR